MGLGKKKVPTPEQCKSGNTKKKKYSLFKTKEGPACVCGSVVEHGPMHQKITGSIPAQDTYPDCRIDP